MRGHLGIIGGGQLGLMLAQAADELGVVVWLADRVPDAPAARRSEFRLVQSWGEAVQVLTPGAQAVTWDREDVPLDALHNAAGLVPSAAALAAVQDRLAQKQLLDAIGLPTAPWIAAANASDAGQVIAAIGLPVMVKARRGGFDGRGQMVARDRASLEAALDRFAQSGCIVESLIPFDDECAVLVTRSADDDLRHYPMVWTYQDDGQLSWAMAPHPRESALGTVLRPMIARLVRKLNYVGTLAMECFRCGDTVLVNEIAPRVHNSGHWTIEGCVSSQFSNHVRAACGLPLGDTALRQHCLMLNCIGTMPEQIERPGVTWHDYGKKPRPGRKVGHLTVVGRDAAELQERVAALPPDLLKRYALPTGLRKAA
jgi:5-(carboxyamino)imidazole ribonucleotide synthase